MSENISSYTPATLVELLRYRAEEQPHQQAYTFLEDGETDTVEWTYAQLDQQARQIAAWLQQVGAPRDRVLLLYPAGLEYIAAFFGCLYADMVAVPAYPPRLNRPAPRLQAIAADTTAQLALTTTPILTDLQRRFDQMPELKALRWLATDQPENGPAAGDWRQPRLTGETLAFLQYTSGSTNTPVGVQLSHTNLLHNLSLIQYGLKVDSTSSFFSWLPLYHDMGLIGNVLEPLYAGIPLVLSSPTSFIERPIRWLQAITRYKSTISGGPNFAYQLCVDRITPEERVNLDLSSWQVAFCAAEPIRAETLERFSTAFAFCGFRRKALYPCYGLAEATLMVSGGLGPAEPIICAVERTAIEQNRVVEVAPHSDNSQQFVGCGQTLLDQKIVIVDPESRTPVAADQVGEIWTSSPSVSSGYWQRAEATQTNFQAYLADTNSGPYLRTGDLGFVKNGELFVTGRIKELIIIHGRNYYPQDIEQTAEQSHPALQPSGSAAFSIPVNGQEQLVIVHEVKRSQRHVAIAEVAQAVRRAVAEAQELPIYALVLVKPSRVPRTSSGKIQRNLCRKEFLAGDLEMLDVSYLGDNPLVAGTGESLPDFVAPGTPIEQALAGIWGEVLGLNRVGRYDNFFELGGNSLVITQVMARVRDLCSVEIPLRQLFETPTIATMAEQVEAALRKGPQLETLPLQAGPRPQHIPMSFSQERMWVIYQLDPTSAAYNIVGALRFKGQLDVAALGHAMGELTNRHESLRTSFELVAGQPVQIIAPSLELKIKQIDLRHLPAQEREPQAVELAGQEAQQPFDLGQAPLWRLSLYCLAADENLLVINLHHTICDAWSLGVMLHELGAFYKAYQIGQPAQLPELPVQYADYSIWQREWLHGEVLEAHVAYWRKQLAGVPVLELPTDRPRPAVQSFWGAHQSVTLPDTLLDALREFSSAEGVTLFMTLLTAFKSLLLRYTGQTDIAVGTPIANRQWQVVEGLIGTFVNTLVFRTDVSGSPTFRELLQRVREISLDAYAHQDMPFAKLVAELQPDRDRSYSPLAQVMFNVVNVPLAMPAMPEVTLDFVEIDRRAAQFDLSLTILDTSAMRMATLEYNTDLFDDETITRLLNHYLILLEQIARDPHQRIADAPLLTVAERQLILKTWNATEQAYSRDLCVQQLFEAQASRTPNAVAIKGYALNGTETFLTYGDLDRRANQLAHYLRGKGVKPGVLVGVSIERTVEMVIGLLGILKAGGAYVPLDPAFPADRLAFMMEDARLSIFLTQKRLKNGLPAHIAAGAICLDSDWATIAQEEAISLPATAGPFDLAYILYTSGSTGKPKGVQIPHRALTNFLVSMQQEPGLAAHDRLLAITTLSFDIAGLELYLPLITGAGLILAKREEAADGLRLIEMLDDFGVTVLQATPATWRMLIEVGWQGTPDLKMLCGGEALPHDLALQLLARGGSLWNMYGPTETTIWSSTYEVKREDALIHLGHPIANTQLYVLDSQRQPVPIGVTGELYIGGDGVALGYFNRPELTSERFLPDPFRDEPEARLYRTGDLVRYRRDGTLEFLGRADFQVKVRGFRIELGEIETVISKHPEVQQVVVTAREDRPGDKRLVAYIVPRPGQSPVTNGLSGFVREQLPDYMVPTAFVTLEALPLTPNNKVDRKALPAPDFQRLDAGTLFVAPRNPTEDMLARIWAAVLGVEKVGIHENFFDLGGHSLLATQIVSRVRQHFEIDLPLRDLFENPTVAGLAASIEAIQWAVAQQTSPQHDAPFEREEIEL